MALRRRSLGARAQNEGLPPGSLARTGQPHRARHGFFGCGCIAALDLHDGKGIALTLDVNDAPPAIQSDASRLRQIFSNLLSNAVKFTNAGGVTLRCAAEQDGGEEWLVVTVSDTGIGIPPDQHGMIFEPFHQVDGGMNRQFSGTGLGLSICRNLVRTLGGTISVESQLGAGATFVVRLPLTRAAAEPVRERPEILANTRLLMVEANQLAQGMLRGLIEPHVGSLIFAEDAATARAQLRQVDHILIEGRAMDSEHRPALDELREVIAAARDLDLRTTILFAPSDDLPLGDVAQVGADQLVLKPVGGQQLLASLHELYDPAIGDDARQAVAA